MEFMGISDGNLDGRVKVGKRRSSSHRARDTGNGGGRCLMEVLSASTLDRARVLLGQSGTF